MIIFGLDLCCPILRFVICALFAAFVVCIVLLRIYACITCGFYKKSNKMDGKTVIITGGNGGIGRETAKEIARRGARVILACRNLETANKVKDDIIKETNNQNVIVKQLDLSSLESVRKFAEDINKTEPRLDVLLHNAGVAVNKIVKTKDDLEMTMATNHFGPFLLTHLLIDLLKKTAPSRIVVVASELYRLAKLDLNNINPSSSWFVPYLYYVSKYANICFTRELARQLEGSGVTANCLHPGLVDTGIWDSAPAVFRYPLKLIVKGFFKTPLQGAQTSIFVACAEELKDVSGKYFSDCREKGLSSGASDENKAKKLWELSEKLVNLKPDDPKIC